MSADATPSDATLSWSHTSEESRLLRALVGVPKGVIDGGLLAFVIGVVGAALLLVVNGSYALGIAVVVAAVFGVARIAPHLFARIDGEYVFFDEFRGPERWYAAVGVLGGLGVLAVGVRFGSRGFLLAVLGTVLAPLLVAAGLSSEGELDARARTLTYGGTDIDLRTLDGVRRLPVGGYAVYRLSYVSGAATFSTPRYVVIPQNVDSEVRAAFDAGVAESAATPASSTRAVRVAALGMGIFFFAFAGLLLTVEPTGPNPRAGGVLWYAASVAGLFGALFVGIGIRTE
ncbi:hypothetical protein [Halorussus amylolyticus]|uniref:hypothetical protein n=1 Tax=Halorussus amylolyticus TaxID=1126242 RepID=UPI001053B94C|nr:hypothetical protein [Halorussus amylolyticus]